MRLAAVVGGDDDWREDNQQREAKKKEKCISYRNETRGRKDRLKIFAGAKMHAYMNVQYAIV